jgi:hypothetical protein
VREGRGGESVEEASEGRGAPAAVLIAAERTSTGELRQRRAVGKEGAGAGRWGWRRPSGPWGDAGARGKNSLQLLQVRVFDFAQKFTF